MSDLRKVAYCNTCGHDKICACNDFYCEDCATKEAQLKIAVEAIRVYAACDNNFLIISKAIAKKALEEIEKMGKT